MKKERKPQKPDFSIGSTFKYSGFDAILSGIDKENVSFKVNDTERKMSRGLFEDLVREGQI